VTPSAAARALCGVAGGVALEVGWGEGEGEFGGAELEGVGVGAGFAAVEVVAGGGFAEDAFVAGGFEFGIVELEEFFDYGDADLVAGGNDEAVVEGVWGGVGVIGEVEEEVDFDGAALTAEGEVAEFGGSGFDGGEGAEVEAVLTNWMASRNVLLPLPLGPTRTWKGSRSSQGVLWMPL